MLNFTVFARASLGFGIYDTIIVLFARLDGSGMLEHSQVLMDFKRVAEANDWASLHTPRNLATAVVTEAVELLSLFQWQQDDDLLREHKHQAGSEVADVYMYLLALCDRVGIDFDAAVTEKIAHNRQRFLAAEGGE